MTTGVRGRADRWRGGGAGTISCVNYRHNYNKYILGQLINTSYSCKLCKITLMEWAKWAGILTVHDSAGTCGVMHSEESDQVID